VIASFWRLYEGEGGTRDTYDLRIAAFNGAGGAIRFPAPDAAVAWTTTYGTIHSAWFATLRGRADAPIVPCGPVAITAFRPDAISVYRDRYLLVGREGYSVPGSPAPEFRQHAIRE
jgi:hypothetical protein